MGPYVGLKETFRYSIQGDIDEERACFQLEWALPLEDEVDGVLEEIGVGHDALGVFCAAGCQAGQDED